MLNDDEELELNETAGELDRPREMLPAAPHAGGGPSLKLRLIRSSIKLPVVGGAGAADADEGGLLSGPPKSTRSINDDSLCAGAPLDPVLLLSSCPIEGTADLTRRPLLTWLYCSITLLMTSLIWSSFSN